VKIRVQLAPFRKFRSSNKGRLYLEAAITMSSEEGLSTVMPFTFPGETPDVDPELEAAGVAEYVAVCIHLRSSLMSFSRSSEMLILQSPPLGGEAGKHLMLLIHHCWVLKEGIENTSRYALIRIKTDWCPSQSQRHKRC